jgi:DNA-binding MarR family transcriptional regulator
MMCPPRRSSTSSWRSRCCSGRPGPLDGCAGPDCDKTHLLWEVHSSGPSAQQRLAEAIGVSPRHVTGLVDALEADGFARRLPHPQDRRSVLVELTDKGAATVANMQRQRSRDAAALVEGLDAGTVQALRSQLDTVLSRLRQLVAEGSHPASGGDA